MTPLHDDTSLAGSNNFDFKDEASRCPFSAHIRKVCYSRFFLYGHSVGFDDARTNSCHRRTPDTIRPPMDAPQPMPLCEEVSNSEMKLHPTKATPTKVIPAILVDFYSSATRATSAMGFRSCNSGGPTTQTSNPSLQVFLVRSDLTQSLDRTFLVQLRLPSILETQARH